MLSVSRDISNNNYDSGLEFNTASTSTVSVRSSSKMREALPSVFFKQRLTDSMSCSNIPPHQGAFSKLKHHSTRMSQKYLFTSTLSTTFRINVEADLNVLPLSEITFTGIPRLAVKHLKLLMKVKALRSGTKSTCTALVAQQVYKHNQTLPPSTVVDRLMYSGPAKSTPIWLNGRDLLTW